MLFIWAFTFISFIVVLFYIDDSSSKRIQFYARFIKSEPKGGIIDDVIGVQSKANCGLITFKFKGKTGNQMFQYASLYGIAKANNKMAFINPDFPLFDAFKLSTLKLNMSLLDESNFLNVSYPGTFGFTKSVFNLSCHEDYVMRGLRSSWKYFSKYSSEIKKEFQFVDDIHIQCNKVMKEIMTQNNISKHNNCILIGAHMRRGDFVRDKKQDYGHVPATKDYLHKAIKFFENRYSNNPCKLFLVVGNDHKWNLNNSLQRNNVIVLKPRSPYLDLCILSRCNHTIISSGSFGWWAAYLSGGDTTFMANQCRPNSTLCSKFKLNNYINPEWNWFPL